MMCRLNSSVSGPRKKHVEPDMLCPQDTKKFRCLTSTLWDSKEAIQGYEEDFCGVFQRSPDAPYSPPNSYIEHALAHASTTPPEAQLFKHTYSHSRWLKASWWLGIFANALSSRMTH